MDTYRASARFTGLLWTILFCSSASAVGEESTASGDWDLTSHVSVYSESSFISPVRLSQQSRSDLRIARYSDLLDFYGGIALSHDFENDSYTAAYPGARLWLGSLPVAFFAEHRWMLAHTLGERGTDRRIGGYGYTWQDLDLSGDGDSELFAEVYGEVVHTDRILQDVIGAGWVKLGKRVRLGRSWSIDPHLELFAKRDTAGFAGENTQELRPAVRVAASLGDIGVALTGGYAWGGTSAEAAPSYGTSYRHWRGLLVVSGGF